MSAGPPGSTGTAGMNPDDCAAIALIGPVVAGMAHLHRGTRIALLCALLAQEICLAPPSERRAELNRVMAELPGILQATEEGMRHALTQNARAGL